MIRMLKIESLTTPNKVYTVRLIDNEFFCSCLDFLMRSRIKKTCKHIEKAKESFKAKENNGSNTRRSRANFDNADYTDNSNKSSRDFKLRVRRGADRDTKA